MRMKIYVDRSGESTKRDQMCTCFRVIVSEDKSNEKTTDLNIMWFCFCDWDFIFEYYPHVYNSTSNQLYRIFSSANWMRWIYYLSSSISNTKFFFFFCSKQIQSYQTLITTRETLIPLLRVFFKPFCIISWRLHK